MYVYIYLCTCIFVNKFIPGYNRFFVTKKLFCNNFFFNMFIIYRGKDFCTFQENICFDVTRKSDTSMFFAFTYFCSKALVHTKFNMSLYVTKKY